MTIDANFVLGLGSGLFIGVAVTGLLIMVVFVTIISHKHKKTKRVF